MTSYLSSDNFPTDSSEESGALANKLDALLASDFNGNYFSMLANYQRILADNHKRHQWPEVHDKLKLLFYCGEAVPLDGPMIGIPVSIRDSDYFKSTAKNFGKDRSVIAKIEWMATAWNATFADTGLWMGKTFEPVSREVVANKSKHDPQLLSAYDSNRTRIGRNYFRNPPNPNPLQGLGVPALTPLWNLLDRPTQANAPGFEGAILENNLDKEKAIPYSKTGGIFLADMGDSVLNELNGKSVYQLNYRWPRLNPVYPMTRLIDEVVQIGEGLYLGQLVFATRHYSLGTLSLSALSKTKKLELGEAYKPHKHSELNLLKRLFHNKNSSKNYYGYQNNGYFLMMDPDYAKQIYADDAFPQLRPRKGESGFKELGYDTETVEPATATGRITTNKDEYDIEWVEGWRHNPRLLQKFTTFILEPSPKESDSGDQEVRDLLRSGESVLQMLQGISHEISAQSKKDDRLKHFEKLNRLFRGGVAPQIKDGLFQGHGKIGYNKRSHGVEPRDWYGVEETTIGLDYYHGATLNLHLGFSDTLCPDPESKTEESDIFPSFLANAFHAGKISAPNLMNMTWHNIGKYIFPWAGKSFEQISPRKLSMLLDESNDLAKRYPQRVHELKTHLASAPHYDLVKKNKKHYWDKPGQFAAHLKNGSWDNGMTDQDKEFWIKQSEENWVFGNNLQDKRILTMDPIMRIADMNYHAPEPALQELSEAGPSPFVRLGYIFLGVSNQNSILPMNNGSNNKKNVFQFHYRYPMIGGPAPIGFCLDELVEIADGLFLGQLIYSTALDVPYHSSTDPEKFKYQLFGYFLLLDDEWEYHRQAIKLDTIN